MHYSLSYTQYVLIILIQQMGQYTSDLYQVEDLQSFVRMDALPFRYLWIDFKVSNPENQIYLTKFREEFTVEPHATVDSLSVRVSNWAEGKEKLRVICAGSLKDDAYELIQRSSKIDRAILFCGNKVRANNLMRDYSKIRKACFGYKEVVEAVRAWRKEAEQSLLFYELQEVEAFNRHKANICALTDSKISLKEARDHFKKYCEKFVRKDDQSAFIVINDQYSQLRTAQDGILRETVQKEKLFAFLTNSLLPADFILEEVNTLLRSTSNPRKLAYLRYLISDLFAAIRDYYREAKIQKATYYTLVSLNEEERRRLREDTNKYLMFTHFLQASATEPSANIDLTDGQVVIQITVAAKERGKAENNGLLLFGQRALFNLGNYLRVGEVSGDGLRLRVSLVELPQISGAEWSKKEECLSLNQHWLSLQQEKYEGQCFSMLLHDQRGGLNLIGSRISAVQNERHEVKDKVTFKWTLARQRWKIRNNSPADGIQEQLIALLDTTDPSNRPAVLLALCELFFTRQLDNKFRNAVKRLSHFKDVMASDPRAQIFSQYDYFLEGKDRARVVDELQRQEDLLIRYPHYLATEAYQLLANVRIACLGALGRTEEQLELISKLVTVYAVCEGTSSPDFTRINHLKVTVVARKDEELNQREIQRKNKLYRSAVPIEQLKEADVNEPLPINASKLDFALFD